VSEPPEIPLYGSEEGRTADVVRCPVVDAHIARRVVFEKLGGCPYCLHTPAERVAVQRRAERENR